MKYKNKTVIIIPCYNEEKYIASTLNNIIFNSNNDIIVVNDCSTDNTVNIVEKYKKKYLNITLLHTNKNNGKSGALKVGLNYAKYNNYKKCILIDGDNQHNPQQIAKIERLLYYSDLVLTKRVFTQNMPFIKVLGNTIINKLASYKLNIKISDITCGYKGFHLDLIRYNFNSNGYNFEFDILKDLITFNNDLTYSEIETDCIYHDKSKGTNIFDGVKMVWHILNSNMKTNKKVF